MPMFKAFNRCGVTIALSVWMAFWLPSVGAAEMKAADAPANAYEHPQWLVALPVGRRLNLFCTGSGEPVVILEAGGGEDSLTFRRVQGRLSSLTRVCSYDRAGIGFSDPSDAPSTAEHIVSDLHALIAAAGIPTPFVFVGHSNGGLYGRLYAAEYPDDVAGMVFIDPNSVGLDMAAEGVLNAVHLKKWRTSDQADIAQARQCVALAHSGALARNPKARAACLDDPPNADAALHRVLNEQMSRPSEQEAYLSETVDTYPQPDGSLPNAELAIQRVTFDFKDKPFIVMSGTNEQGALPAVLRAKVRKAMLANQADLAAHSTRGRQVFVNVTTEDIQLTQPDAVARYVTEVVQEVRARAASAPGT